MDAIEFSSTGASDSRASSSYSGATASALEWGSDGGKTTGAFSFVMEEFKERVAFSRVEICVHNFCIVGRRSTGICCCSEQGR